MWLGCVRMERWAEVGVGQYAYHVLGEVDLLGCPDGRDGLLVHLPDL